MVRKARVRATRSKQADSERRMYDMHFERREHLWGRGERNTQRMLTVLGYEVNNTVEEE